MKTRSLVIFSCIACFGLFDLYVHGTALGQDAAGQTMPPTNDSQEIEQPKIFKPAKDDIFEIKETKAPLY